MHRVNSRLVIFNRICSSPEAAGRKLLCQRPLQPVAGLPGGAPLPPPPAPRNPPLTVRLPDIMTLVVNHAISRARRAHGLSVGRTVCPAVPREAPCCCNASGCCREALRGPRSGPEARRARGLEQAAGSARDRVPQGPAPSPPAALGRRGRAGPPLSVELQPPSAPAQPCPALPRPRRTQRAAGPGALSWRSPGE